MENTKIIKVPDRPIGLSSPAKLSEFAKELKKFIVKRNLYSVIKGKNYVNVEGWQFAGAAAGVFPVVKSVERINTGDEAEIKYRAEVQLVTTRDKVVGYGVAICSNREQNRIKQAQKTGEKVEEYVIASMAQTRAVAKAYRNIFAWLMKIAGYESTPAEEVAEAQVSTIPESEKDGEPASPAQIRTVETLAKKKGEEINAKELNQRQAKELIQRLIKENGNGK